MSSRLVFGRGSGEVAYKSVGVDANTTLSLPIINLYQYQKFELEYAFKIGGTINKLETGRITVIYNGTTCEVVSHEREHSSTLGVQTQVTIVPYILLTDMGLAITNISIESFDFKYLVNNRVNL